MHFLHKQNKRIQKYTEQEQQQVVKKSVAAGFVTFHISNKQKKKNIKKMKKKHNNIESAYSQSSLNHSQDDVCMYYIFTHEK